MSRSALEICHWIFWTPLQIWGITFQFLVFRFISCTQDHVISCGLLGWSTARRISKSATRAHRCYIHSKTKLPTSAWPKAIGLRTSTQFDSKSNLDSVFAFWKAARICSKQASSFPSLSSYIHLALKLTSSPVWSCRPTSWLTCRSHRSCKNATGRSFTPILLQFSLIPQAHAGTLISVWGAWTSQSKSCLNAWFYSRFMMLHVSFKCWQRRNLAKNRDD